LVGGTTALKVENEWTLKQIRPQPQQEFQKARIVIGKQGSEKGDVSVV
jgi:hypothetical protein